MQHVPDTIAVALVCAVRSELAMSEPDGVHFCIGAGHAVLDWPQDPTAAADELAAEVRN
jgi:hypothetical protein